MLKRLDAMMLRSILAPFVATFFVTLFALIMQFLWTYIDDLLGKGLSAFYIIEMLFYMSIALVVTAFPMAMLIASIMVMGNMSEKYELAALKSSGVSLTRVMLPLMVFGSLIGVVSFISSNYLIPVANLKAKSRLYDIRKKKPALSLAPGVFNNDFQNFAIRIGDKSDDDKEIYDVLIYDHSSKRGNDVQTLAESGRMDMTENDRYLRMTLFNGSQYRDQQPSTRNRINNYAHIRTNFASMEKAFDLSEFEMEQTREDAFENNQNMLSLRQLSHAIDSMYLSKSKKGPRLARNVMPYFSFRKVYPGKSKDTILVFTDNVSVKPKLMGTEKSIIEYIPSKGRLQTVQRASTSVKNIKGYTRSAVRTAEQTNELIVYHKVAYWKKFSQAFACLMFLFIGAPLGAIIRKGGFGLPILLGIVFFVSFIVMTIVGDKLAQAGTVTPFIGMFLPCFVFMPMGLYLTYQALNDNRLFEIRLPSFLSKKSKTAAV